MIASLYLADLDGLPPVKPSGGFTRDELIARARRLLTVHGADTTVMEAIFGKDT